MITAILDPRCKEEMSWQELQCNGHTVSHHWCKVREIRGGNTVFFEDADSIASGFFRADVIQLGVEED